MPIKLAENFRALFYAPFYATQALGFYAREGVEIEFLRSSAPGDAVSALIEGRIDLTWGGPMRVMKARDLAPDAPLVCFCEVVARDPFYLVGRGDPAKFRLADLPAVRFAAVSEVPTPWLCLQHDLRAHGVDPARLDRAAARTMADNLAALRDGRLDVVQVFEPYASMALREGFQILYAASARGPTVYTAFIATRDGIARHRATFAAMTRATRHMQDWLTGHGPAELAEVVAPFFPDIAPDILTDALRRYGDAGVWSRDTAVSREGFVRLGESLLSGGFISRMPAYEDCVLEP
jgi:NitT/TauT family transport system substrate-binding protein